MPPVGEESPPLHAGWGWGSCVATTLRSGKRVKERRKTGDEKGKGTEKGGEAWGNHQTLGEPVWLTRARETPEK